MRAAAAEANAVRPTFAGIWFLLVLAGVTFGAVNTGNNLVYVVLAALLAVLVVNNLLAEWNLRSLEVERRLPPELFARGETVGALVLRNRRRWGAAWRVEVEERDVSGARAVFPCVPPGAERASDAAWALPRRGLARLDRVRVASRFPFGIILRYRDLSMPVEVLVFPALRDDGTVDAAAPGGDGGGAVRERAGGGDLTGLRAYREGDPVRRIHWPTTARTGAPVVVQRAGDAASEVVIRVPDGADERTIERACGRVVAAAAQGDAVGLHLADRAVPPRTGSTHRRHLLTLLASLPHVVGNLGGRA